MVIIRVSWSQIKLFRESTDEKIFISLYINRIEIIQDDLERKK